MTLIFALLCNKFHLLRFRCLSAREHKLVHYKGLFDLDSTEGFQEIGFVARGLSDIVITLVTSVTTKKDTDSSLGN